MDIITAQDAHLGLNLANTGVPRERGKQLH